MKSDKMSQELWVRIVLKDHGEISRNHALENRVTRLAAIIRLLKNKGWGIEGEERNGDYIYKLKWKPN